MLENQVGNVQLMQRMNRLKVLNVVRRSGRIQRAQIAAETGLSLASVTNIINYLISLGLVLDSEREPCERVGRKASILEFDYKAYHLVCCAVNGKEIVTAVCAMDGSVADKRVCSVTSDLEGTICNEVREIVMANPDIDIMAAGIAVSAMVLENGNTVLSSTLGYSIHGMADRLRSRLDMPVIIDNLSIANAVYHASESFGDTGNLLFVDFDGGIGAVHLYKGEVDSGFVGEIGHITADIHSDIPCPCGNKGCLERLCSPETVMKNAGVSDMDTLKERYISGDNAAVRAVDDCMHYLAVAIGGLIDIMAPDRIIFSGSEFFGCRPMYEQFLEYIRKRTLSGLCGKTAFNTVSTDTDRALCGMALHLCDAVFDISFDNMIE